MLGVDAGHTRHVRYRIQQGQAARSFHHPWATYDDIGAVPYFLKKFDSPVYGTRLTLGIIEGKFEEHDISSANLVEVKAGQTIKAGVFSVEFIRVNHSIADACALCITTPVASVIHTGDFKIDLTPLNGEPIDLARFAGAGLEGRAAAAV